MQLEKGLVQVYTGNGKGKTTASIGLGIRAYGNGLKVIMIQFLKSGVTGELEVLNNLGENFKVYRFEKEKDFTWNLTEEQKEELQKEISEGFNFAKKVVKDNMCDMLILDEVMASVNGGYIDEEDVLKLIESKNDKMELVLTGRNVPKAIVDKSDLITEMKDVKHYFNKGIPARKGIEF
ncbi:cob(I)yrinic acid a,c-diamide adenosyltransferase [Clostridium saudiense]|nr:cob(I)yrinic acid a,c-diamide adenosyltransferase [Clostridium saudiense]